MKKFVPIWIAVGMVGWCVTGNAVEGDWATFGCLLFICFALFWAQGWIIHGEKR